MISMVLTITSEQTGENEVSCRGIAFKVQEQTPGEAAGQEVKELNATGAGA
jgi:hypothetical protein